MKKIILILAIVFLITPYTYAEMGYFRKDIALINAYGDEIITIKAGTCLEVHYLASRRDLIGESHTSNPTRYVVIDNFDLAVFKNETTIGFLIHRHTVSVYDATNRRSKNASVVLSESCQEALALSKPMDIEDKQQAERERQQQLAVKRERERITARIKTFPEDIERCIKNKEIKLGMTQEQVLLSWGKPSSTNRSVGSWGVHEQWVYGNRYVYFENNILTSWQD